MKPNFAQKYRKRITLGVMLLISLVLLARFAGLESLGLRQEAYLKIVADEIAKTPQVAPQPLDMAQVGSIEFVRRRITSQVGGHRVFADYDCGHICHGLLRGGSVKWVRERLTDGHTGQEETAVYRLATGPECHRLYSKIPKTRSCIVYAKDNGEKADIVVTYSGAANKKILAMREYGPVEQTGTTTLTATDQVGRVLFLRTAFNYIVTEPRSRWNIPIAGQGWSKDLNLGNPRSYLTSLYFKPIEDLQALGFVFAEALGKATLVLKHDDAPNPFLSARLLSLLEAYPASITGDVPFRGGKHREFSGWIYRLKIRVPLDNEVIAIMCLMASDSRIFQHPKIKKYEALHGKLNCAE